MVINGVEPNVTLILEEWWFTFTRRRKTRGGGDHFSSQRQMNMLFAPTEIPMVSGLQVQPVQTVF
jgi:hypothetical protein